MFSRSSALRATLIVAFAAAAVAASPAFVAAQDGPPEVVVTNAGAEPRTALRYDLDAMQPQTMVMTMDITTTMSGLMGNQSQVMPRMVMTMPITDVQRTGDNLTVSYSIEGMQVEEREGVMPGLTEMLEASLAGMGTITGSLTMDARGALIDSSFDVTGADAAVAAQMQSMQDSMQQMTVPLPEEAVGVGAEWTVTTTVTASGMTVDQIATYQLTEVTATGAVLAVSISQIAGNQRLEDPSLPPGMTITLDSLDTNGSGTMRLNFTQLVPTSEMGMSSSMSMSMSDPSGGTLPPMSMVNEMAIQIAPQ